MQTENEDLLHPRLHDECFKLFKGGHFKHAALEAMQSVESALREKGVASPATFGVKMIRKTFGRSSHIMLSVELGDKAQDDAAKFFEGAFSFYRNYAVHDGTRIDNRIALRVMVLASELLDLLGASRRSFTAIGGVDGLLAHRFFDSLGQVAACLKFLDGNSFPDTTMDGFMEDQAETGVSDKQIEVVFDLRLVVAHEQLGRDSFADTDIIITTFALTGLGRKVLEEAEAGLLGSAAGAD